MNIPNNQRLPRIDGGLGSGELNTSTPVSSSTQQADTPAITAKDLRDTIAVAFQKKEGGTTALTVSEDVELFITRTATGVRLALDGYEAKHWERVYRYQKCAVTGTGIAMRKLGLAYDGLETPLRDEPAKDSHAHPSMCGSAAAPSHGSVWTRFAVKYGERAELKSGGKEIVATVVEVEPDTFEATLEFGGALFRDVFETNWSAKNASIKLAKNLLGWLRD
ncbi:MAG: hypothetical protein EON58_01005 [Alphaproteobacteria bacterium]|nr:MAG: hypothetical protein EON58_01005 [Alphaproteobacteria bacterium]